MTKKKDVTQKVKKRGRKAKVKVNNSFDFYSLSLQKNSENKENGRKNKIRIKTSSIDMKPHDSNEDFSINAF